MHYPSKFLILCLAAMVAWGLVLALPIVLVIWAGLSILWVAAGALGLVALIWALLLAFRKSDRATSIESHELRPVSVR